MSLKKEEVPSKRKSRREATQEDKSTTLFDQLNKKQRKCIAAVDQPVATDMVRVTARLDALQASIDRLVALCLQEEHGDSSGDEPVRVASKE